jgi:hypothetical protein
MDLEARIHSTHPQALRLWLRMLTCSQLIEKQVRAGLRDEFNTTLPRFDLMAQLEREPQGMKMNELSRRMMVTGGNITPVTDQLVKEGWVERMKPGSSQPFHHSVNATCINCTSYWGKSNSTAYLPLWRTHDPPHSF